MQFDKHEEEVISHLFSYLNDNSYIVGGFLRDNLFNLKSHDLDFVTDIKPDILKRILPYKYAFIKMGNFSFNYLNYDVTITTLRKEKDYLDYRHPSTVEFIDDIDVDYLRRDFTINSLYMDKNYNLYDPSSYSINDISNKTLRMILDPDIRLKEDPLRIIRAYRFKLEYNLKIEENLNKSLISNLNLIKFLNKKKVEDEIKKSSHHEELIKLLGEYYEY